MQKREKLHAVSHCSEVHSHVICQTAVDMVSDTTVVLDNGGCTIKVGLAGNPSASSVFPNCLGKVKGGRQWMIGDMLLSTRDISCLSLRRPIDRGYVVNWDTEQEIWSRTFEKILRIDPAQSTLLLTEAPFALDGCKAATEEVVFETLGFNALHTCSAAELAFHDGHQLPSAGSLARQARAGVVLDCGFSFTHAVPIFDGQCIPRGIRRINIGGKLVTNLLKEMVSYRSLNMMEDTFVVELAKDAVSFVSQNPAADLDIARQKRSPLSLEYVLPDGVHNLRGFAREPQMGQKKTKAEMEQTLTLTNERFMPMEAFFRPVDIGMNQAGVAEAVVQAVKACPPELAPLLYQNVVITGGAAKCPGFRERLEAELRPLVPDTLEINVSGLEEPELAAWRGGSRFAVSPDFHQVKTTRAEYNEHGRSAARRHAEA